MEITAVDHFVLRCRDVETTLQWYRERLGLAPVRVEEWRGGEAPFPSVRVDAGTIIDLIPAPDAAAGGHLDHICFVVSAAAVEAIAADDTFDVIDGPAPRFGARGMGTSVYVRDPDGLVVELRTYPDDLA